MLKESLELSYSLLACNSTTTPSIWRTDLKHITRLRCNPHCRDCDIWHVQIWTYRWFPETVTAKLYPGDMDYRSVKIFSVTPLSCFPVLPISVHVNACLRGLQDPPALIGQRSQAWAWQCFCNYGHVHWKFWHRNQPKEFLKQGNWQFYHVLHIL